MQQQVRTIGIVLITVLLVIAYVVLRPHPSPSKVALTQYAPPDVSFALLLERDFAYENADALATRIPQLADAVQFTRSEWDALENSLDTRIDEALWYFRAPSGTSGLLLATASPLSGDQTKMILSQTYSFTSINNAVPVNAIQLAPSVILLGAPGDEIRLHDELFNNRQAGAVVHASGSFPRAVGELAGILGLHEKTAPFPFTAYIDAVGGMFRLQILSPADSVVEQRMLGLSLPKDAEIIFDGIPVQAGAGLSELQPFGRISTGLVHRLSDTYSVPTSLVMEQLPRTDALILRDADWMLASRSTTTLAVFASELMSWAHPRIREGKLPDRTAFREYIRTPVAMQELDSHGRSMLFWGHASSTLATTGPDKGIYGIFNGVFLAIANKRDLLETVESDQLNALDFPQAAACFSGSELSGQPYSFFADFSKKNNLSQPLVSILGSDATGKRAVFLICF
ncbi:MAG: hypothetical protein HY422_03020 [Candidatus Komeilibacteria bacterium]|nr:hypothetical protein [Candidatus Komeilibacteria bacterium]